MEFSFEALLIHRGRWRVKRFHLFMPDITQLPKGKDNELETNDQWPFATFFPYNTETKLGVFFLET